MCGRDLAELYGLTSPERDAVSRPGQNDRGRAPHDATTVRGGGPKRRRAAWWPTDQTLARAMDGDR